MSAKADRSGSQPATPRSQRPTRQVDRSPLRGPTWAADPTELPTCKNTSLSGFVRFQASELSPSHRPGQLAHRAFRHVRKQFGDARKCATQIQLSQFTERPLSAGTSQALPASPPRRISAAMSPMRKTEKLASLGLGRRTFNLQRPPQSACAELVEAPSFSSTLQERTALRQARGERFIFNARCSRACETTPRLYRHRQRKRQSARGGGTIRHGVRSWCEVRHQTSRLVQEAVSDRN